MAIHIMIVKEDFKTVVASLSFITNDNDFHYLQKVAQEMQLPFIATIYPKGGTIINQLQVDPFTQEIQQLRTRVDVNQSIIDQLYQAATTVDVWRCQYIKFAGS